jgi:hypothetical protein
MSHWPEVAKQLDVIVNQWYETPEIHRLLTVPLSPTRLAFRHLHMTFFGNNRRDCWAAVGSKAPLDVKRAIWEHEKDELIYDPRMGKAHVTEERSRQQQRIGSHPRRACCFLRLALLRAGKSLARRPRLLPHSRTA